MISAVLVTAFALIVIVLVKRVVTHIRLHHPVANWRFMRQHRGKRPLGVRPRVESGVSASGLPVDRPATLTAESAMDLLPSHTWALNRLHWHGFAEPSAIPIALWTPPAVATWTVASTGRRDLHESVVTAAASGESVRVDRVVVESATTDRCVYQCVA